MERKRVTGNDYLPKYEMSSVCVLNCVENRKFLINGIEWNFNHQPRRNNEANGFASCQSSWLPKKKIVYRNKFHS